MRELFPNDCNRNGVLPNGNAVTQEQLLAVLTQIQELNDRLTETINYIDDYKAENASGIRTLTLEAENIKASNAKISSLLEATEANITDADFTTITVDELADIKKVVAEIVQITESLITKELVAETASLGTANILEADISNLKAKTIEIENWLIETFTVDNLKANVEIETPLVKAETAEVETVNATDVITETIEVDMANIAKENVQTSDIKTLKTSSISWQQYQTIVNPDEFYIEIPRFINGAYYLAAIDDTNTVCFTIEVQNSINNYYVSWSKILPGFLEKFYIDKTDKTSQIYFKANTLGRALTLKYASIGLEQVAPPQEYDILPINAEVEYDIVYLDGHKYWNPVDLFNDGTAVGTLSLIPQAWNLSTPDATNYDTTQNVQFNIYRPNQNLNTDADVEFNSATTQWLNVHTFTTPTFVASDEDISTFDLSPYENGSLINMKDNLKARQWRKDGDELNPVIPYKSVENTLVENPVIYDNTDDTLKRTKEITLETLNATDIKVEGEAEVKGRVNAESDVYISGDLFVAGGTHTTTTEDISAESDVITLRANNNLSLETGQIAGIVINKYDGIDDLAIVTDNEGTARVGTGRGTPTPYTNIAFNNEDNLYYRYTENADDTITYALMNPQPQGTMTDWAGKEQIDGYTLYPSAIFTVIEKTSLQPLLTRSEEADLTDGAVLVWDATNTKAVGTIAPTNSMQTLVSKITDGKVSYEWGSAGSAGLAFIGTRAEYEVAKLIPEGEEGHIPAKSFVLLLDENDNVQGDIIQ